MTTEPNAQPTAQSAWAQALKGKTGASPVAAHSKKMFFVLSGSFFLCFCFLYMIYNVRHSQTAAQAGANVQAIPVGTQMQAQMQAQPAAAFTGNQFGAPRIDAATPANAMYSTSMAVNQPMAMAPAQAPSGMTGYGQPSPYGAAPAAYPPSASYPQAAAYPPASYAGPHMAYAQHQRSDLVISAPRQFRHSIPTLGAGGQPEPLNQRHRTYVAR